MTQTFVVTLNAVTISAVTISAMTFEASATAPLLIAADAAGLRWPSSCRNGSCRTCICRAIDGTVGYRIEWPGLSREEKQEGYILPCVAYPQSDLTLIWD
jgi:ferredoxin